MEKERTGKIGNKSEERSGKNEIGNFKFGEKMLQIFGFKNDRIFQFSGICATLTLLFQHINLC